MQYYINGTELSCLPYCRDLGITIYSDLSPSRHIQEITTKANQCASCILQCFVFRSIGLLVSAFVVYVQPMLENNSVIWSPHLKQDIMRIEKVQALRIQRLVIHAAFG